MATPPLSRGNSHGHLSQLHALTAGDSVPFSRPHTPHKELTVGFYGLGSMGYAMARNLVKRLSSPLVVANRTRSKAEQLQKELGESKVKIVDTPAAIAQECDIILTNLANDAVVKTIYEQFTEALSVSTFLVFQDDSMLTFYLRV